MPNNQGGGFKEMPHLLHANNHPFKGHTMLLGGLLHNHMWLNYISLLVIKIWMKWPRKSIIWN